MDKLLRKKDMAENLEHTETAQELAEVIEEFEQYRERLVKETMETAKRAKLPKTKVLSQLEPELAKIDAILQNLRDRQAAL